MKATSAVSSLLMCMTRKSNVLVLCPLRLPALNVLPHSGRLIELHAQEHKEPLGHVLAWRAVLHRRREQQAHESRVRLRIASPWLPTIAFAFATSPRPSWILTGTGPDENVTKTFTKGGLAS